MNVNSIMYQTSNTSGMGNIFNNGSFLSIGNKGQIVEGVISKVSDKISINFNGVEVSVPHSAVREATEGETRKFQIMDVSKDSIVLKEVGNSYNQGVTRAMVNTKAPDSVGASGNRLNESAQVAAGEQEAAKNIAILTGEDYKEIEEKEGAIDGEEEFTSLERALERVKEYKEWEANCKESNEELCKELAEGLENVQKYGFLDQKSESEIAQILRDADIPATLDNISKVVSALKMSQMANVMSNDVKSYIISKDMSPTIKNIYHGQYSGSDAFDGEVYDNEAWDLLESQIKDIINLTGLDYETAAEDAKWLLANDLPMTAENLKTLDVLRDIKENMTLDKALVQIVQAMSAGNEAEDALLDTSKFIIARDILNDFQSVTDNDIRAALSMAENNNIAQDNSSVVGAEINLELIKQAKKDSESTTIKDTTIIPNAVIDGMSEQDIQAVTAKRHITEICLKMTVQSATLMAEKGINIETAPLEDIVKELRDIENSYYIARFGASGDITEKELGIMQEALQKTSDIANAPVSLIGIGVRQMNLLSFNELHAAAVSETSQKQQFMEIYEKVATEPGDKYGDSIEKAFARSVPDILESLGLENTQANERAVRILGYNNMDITVDNINAVKDYDTSLNRVIDNMKPSVVLDMIRTGGNPLDKTIRELDIELSEIAAKKDISSEEKYSRYLWQLERSNSITEQEREGYIGVYRLLNNIEKTDGAAIGAVMQSKREMTLGNLLTAVRNVKGGRIDIKADSNLGGLDSLVYHSKSITAQISNGFNSEQNKNSGYDGNRYYKGLVSEAIDNITPDSVNELSDGDMEKLLNTSLEKFAEKMKSSSAGKKLVKEYYEKQAEEVREIINNRADAEEYLKSMQIPVTVAALGAAERMLEEGYNPIKDCYNRRNILRDKEKQEFEKTAGRMADALESEDGIKKECEKTSRYMEEILARSYAAPDISSDELMHLKMLGRGIQLNGMMTGRRSYDIPIVTGDTITNMNVTIVNGSGDKGKVQVYVDNTKNVPESVSALNISAEFRVSGDALKGFILCGNRQNYEAVKENSGNLEKALKDAGFTVKNISCSIGTASRGNNAGAKIDKDNISTADLYKVAKIAVKYLSNIINNNIN